MTIGEKLAAQQREQQAQASEWEKRREAGRAWAYHRAGLPVPEGDATDAPREATRGVIDRPWAPPEPAVIARARALIEADHDRWVAIAKADLAELVALAGAP